MNAEQHLEYLQGQIDELQTRIAALLLDPVVGIPVRRAFEEKLHELFDAQCVSGRRRTDRPYGVLVIDIDHFKVVNDTYGHLEGDRILRRVAEAIHGALRGCDFLARYGGEEFVVLVEGADYGTTFQLADRVLRSVQSHTPVTVSVGGSVAHIFDNQCWTAVERADAALYQAKNEGRNCVRMRLR